MVGYLFNAFSSLWYVWLDFLPSFSIWDPYATLLAPLLPAFVGFLVFLPDEDGAGFGRPSDHRRRVADGPRWPRPASPPRSASPRGPRAGRSARHEARSKLISTGCGGNP